MKTDLKLFKPGTAARQIEEKAGTPLAFIIVWLCAVGGLVAFLFGLATGATLTILQ